MTRKPEELPAAVGRVNGESDVVAERAGVVTPRTRRPIPADPPEALDEPQPEEEPEDEEEDVIRIDAGPTG
ncbi:hypothetical protein [Nonomuraea jiangxiensis]|uniref:Uncharacterized protein n=1 Tax=Nonomuraea jiangxiensis TaxID=633440 RepID=A0A1G9RBU6_9ACTN|nr:hypothetical protein [Nonomuraea jiangxiensis]SDM20782.1 hypothetical protein SAMN05421869_13837 [Nonomuraea jiangxiensis]